MDFESELHPLMTRVMRKFNQMEERKRTYGTEVLLSRAEIDTISSIGEHPGIGVTDLASLLGITKGAASQMVYRLVDKGFVEKRTSPESDARVILSLTAAGQKNHEAHIEAHRRAGEEFFALLGDMPESFMHDLIQFLSLLEKTIDKHI